MNEIIKFDLKIFLENCKISSNHAFENLKMILTWLENSNTQIQAREILHDIEDYMINVESSIDCASLYHFSFDKLTITGIENQESKIKLLQLPSIFTPEDWSFTFFEGLMRCSEDEYYHRSIVELGTGNGWISIAIAQKYYPFKIIGLDINPKAIVCAKINLYLNGMNSNGIIQRDSEGKSLFDKVQFEVSDLLQYCLVNKIYLDKVIGCIPQVLSPNLNVVENIISENASDEALFALSNYCSKQGYIEDQFGLGLIARAVEESIQLLKSNGKIIFNLGGRPGQAVLNRLLTRRGFITKTIWQTKIEQAGDTDVLPLVEIEKKSTHRFEFFMSPLSTESISARTAYTYLNSGGRIFHSLNVMEGDLKEAIKMRSIFELLKNDDYKDARSALDLTYENQNLVTEKISFLSKLSEKLISSGCFPYENVKGTTSFRRRIAEFFRLYWKSPITSKNVLISPNRVEIIKNYINIFNIKKSLIDAKLCRNFSSEMLQTDLSNALAGHYNVVIEIPRHCHSICELIETLKPELVVCALTQSEIQNQDSFLRLVDLTKKLNCKLMIDFSENFNLASVQEANGIMEYMSINYLPKHVTLLCELIYNQVYEDLDIAFIISENQNLLKVLALSAELTYSRTSTLNQEYYDTILFNLLNFYIKNDSRDKSFSARAAKRDKTTEKEDLFPISERAINSFLDPAMESEKYEFNVNSVRLDYGENALPSPAFIKSLIMECFARQNISQAEYQVEKQIGLYLSKKFNCEWDENNIILGNGVSSLFSSISKFCAKNSISIIFPTGSYGYFIAATKFWGANIIRVDTKEENFFKYDCKNLKELLNLNKNQKYYLYLNAPISNPIGQIYTPSELLSIYEVCIENNVTIILDTIFSGLEFNKIEDYKLTQRQLLSSIVLGGISKEFSAAGLRLGYAGIYDKECFNFVQQDNLNSVSKTLKYFAYKFYLYRNHDEIFVQEHLENQRIILAERANKLSLILIKNGWDFMECKGGLFLIASPKKIVGKKIKISSQDNFVEVTFDNVHDLLFKATGLLINSSSWCGIPKYCRFVLSVTDIEFNSACEKISDFYLMLK